MRIIVSTLQFGDLPYFRYSESLNRKYCDRHGYDFEIIRAPRQVERCPIWFKVKGVADLLDRGDLVLFIDADAYFIDHTKPLEALAAAHMGGASLLIGTNRLSKEVTFSDTEANSGVFLVRRCAAARQLLEDWWNAPMHVNKRWLWQWPPEQAAFNEFIRVRWAHEIRIIPYVYMNGSDGIFIRHLMGFGFSNVERFRIFREENRRYVG
jgi:hypothetical protein